MMLNQLIKEHLPELIDKGIIQFEVPLAPYTSFKIGGPAEVFCQPKSIYELIDILKFAISFNINYFILGNGSNILVSDKGIEGIVIKTSALNKMERKENLISGYCGASLKNLCYFAREEGLSGLEFASGIPATVGGAVFMNAGAFGYEIKDVLLSSDYLEPNLDSLNSLNPIKHLSAKEHNLAYRSSVFQKQKLIHIKSIFQLQPEDPKIIAERMHSFENKRKEKQPLDLPSAGSVFKRPDGFFTGKLIEECGLRGYQIGKAAISEKHCGFIVNLGGATAADVLALIKYVQDAVYSKFGVNLETEIRFLGKE
ncbi:MAG: UDP-N-acetylmuramate dehydrogenase [Candidatus Cloacimonadaceae bacterium]|jgi:UDP-N-acetylmuramate dehydrogenase|nr:UDP-N-acetylmuramate dehydrogenase [Candidatus Cloacimonadota bacterium]MCB5257847.1 UDP-N-acetylmuramate dehydrogenase [Candidatus Cloacimonadota bacterium]MDD5624685.1 UDP-N-acetylmuramate dehydrogenase [Candidatus Cloacimonadota bacterium]